MKKIDLLIISILVIIFSGFLLVIKLRDNTPTDTFIIVHQGEVLMEVNAYKNQSYSFEGSEGTMIAEVEEGKIRLVHSKCPELICVYQGWINVDSSEPIICIPNEVIISSSTAMYN